MSNATKPTIKRGVPVDRSAIHPNPWNPNKMNPRQQDAVAESIEAYGQVLEILVRPHPDIPEEYQIIDGEHRFNISGDTVFCNVVEGLSEADAKKLTIVMNETRGRADKVSLAQLLADLEGDFGDLEALNLGLPYEENELKELIALAAVDWDSFDDTFENDPEPDTPEQDTPDLTRYTLAVPNDLAEAFDEALDAIAPDASATSTEEVLGSKVLRLLGLLS
jgi:hypothetical protein